MSAIEIQAVSKAFGNVQAVKDLSFTVDAGRVTGFLGPNGAGKSTTLRILLGLIHADGGAATFDGRGYASRSHGRKFWATGHLAVENDWIVAVGADETAEASRGWSRRRRRVV